MHQIIHKKSNFGKYIKKKPMNCFKTLKRTRTRTYQNIMLQTISQFFYQTALKHIKINCAKEISDIT